MKKILIATDGSASAAEAVAFGIELAGEHDAAVIFAHVAPALDVVPLAIYGIGGALPRMPHELTTLDRVPLEEVEQLAAEDGGRSSSKLRGGDTVDEIG
jgi:nucleotide-binding universal stress UspA family protein